MWLLVVLKCVDDDDPMENKNYDPFAGCCVICWVENDTKNHMSPIQKYSNEPIFEYQDRETGMAMVKVDCCIQDPPPTTLMI